MLSSVFIAFAMAMRSQCLLVQDIYSDELVQKGVVTKEDVKRNSDGVYKIINERYEMARSGDFVKSQAQWLSSKWKGLCVCLCVYICAYICVVTI